MKGASAGAMIGGALDTLTIAGATIVAGPVGFAAATTVVASKAAAGTVIGGVAGVVKTISEEKKQENSAVASRRMDDIGCEHEDKMIKSEYQCRGSYGTEGTGNSNG